MENSEKIRLAIIERKDALSLIRKLAVTYGKEKHFLSFFKSYDKLLKSGSIEEKFPLFYCAYGEFSTNSGYNCCYIFEGNEDEICEKIRGLKQKKTGFNPT